MTIQAPMPTRAFSNNMGRKALVQARAFFFKSG